MKTATRRASRHRHTVISLALATALGVSLIAAAPLSAAQTASTHQFAVRSQPLGEALNRVAQTAGVQIMVPPELVRGHTAPTLSGQYTVNQALEKVLDGSGLTHRSTRGGVITVARAQESTAPAKPAAPAPKPAPAAASEPAETQDMAAVQVTGSRIKRAEIEGPSPVTVITAQQMENEGHATVFEALETLVMAGGAVETELSGGFSANAHPLNLRGLGPGRSLLLIDGRRAADYPFPYEGRSNFQNFGNIPSGAVERIEILAGGASAIYGADAVSGVVNVVMKRGYDGDVFKLRGGTSTMGGRDRVDAQWTGGRTGENWSVTYAFQYYYQEMLYGFQRDDWDVRQNPAADPRLGVEPTAALRIRRGGTSSSNPLIALPAGTCQRWGDEFVDWTYRRISGGNVQTLGNACGSYNDDRYVHLSKGKNEAAAYVFGTYNFTDDLEGWGSLQMWDSKVESLGGFESITGPHTDGVGRRGDFFDPQFNAVIGPTRLLTPVDLGGVENMNQHYKERSFDLAAGLRGKVGDRFDWDATLSRSEYDFQRTRRRMVGNLVNDFFFGPQIGTRPNGVPIYRMNLDRWLRPLTPAEYASISTIAKYEAESWVTTGSFVVTGDLFDLPAGPVGMAVVLEASRQGYELDSDPRVQPGVVQLYNLTGTNGGGERDRYAAGIEFSIPITDTLRASLAGRFDKYDDITAVDDAITYNVGLEFRPIDSLLFRGSYATSFRAPDMQLVYAEGAASFATILDEYSCRSGTGLGQVAGAPGRTRAQCNVTGDVTLYQAQTRIAGNPLLKEEEGTSWGAGFVWDIVDNMSLSVDYYRIKLEDAASALTSTYILQNEANCRLGTYPDGSPFPNAASSAFCQNLTSLVTRQSAPGTNLDGRIQDINSAYINTALVDTSGIDASFKYTLDTDRWGDFRLDLGYSLMLTNKYKENEDDDLIDYRDLPLFDYSQRSRARGSLSWALDDWSATVFGTRYGSNWNAAWTERLAPYMVYNLQVGKKFGPNVKVDFTVVNVTDNQFRYDPTQTGYPYFNPWIGADPMGRRYYVSATYKF